MNKYLLWLVIPAALFTYWQFTFFENRMLPIESMHSTCKEFTVGFYNLENLFDTIDDPKIIDEEFLPTSANQWGTKRYRNKLKNMAQVIAALNKNEGVDLLGVCEVENKLVLEDLLKTDKLKSKSYGIVHYDSPDARGIDVALFYDDKKFKLIASKPLKVNYNEKNFATRDILWSTLLYGKDTLHVFVNHWPSRRGGAETSEPKRIAAAQTLKTYLTPLLSNPTVRIVLIGDFNDEPENKSLSEVLTTYDKPQQDCNTCFVNPMIELHRKKLGTYYYRGTYDMFDQIIFTSNLSIPEYLTGNYNAVRIFKEEFITKSDSLKNTKHPSRTFEGPKYNGGYSDHLPVYATLCIRR
jgi:endonuclease/exonuclease/phosphatase family metal-dependent hydrolase